jgi:hypothetical protein
MLAWRRPVPPGAWTAAGAALCTPIRNGSVMSRTFGRSLPAVQAVVLDPEHLLVAALSLPPVAFRSCQTAPNGTAPPAAADDH